MPTVGSRPRSGCVDASPFDQGDLDTLMRAEMTQAWEPMRDLECEAMALRETEPDRSVSLFEAVLLRKPDQVSALRNIGRIHMKQARYELAVAVWERLRSLVADHEPALQLGRAHLRLGNLDLARTWAQRADAIAPHLPSVSDLLLRIARRERPSAPRQPTLGTRPSPAPALVGLMVEVYRQSREGDLAALATSLATIHSGFGDTPQGIEVLRIFTQRCAALLGQTPAAITPDVSRVAKAVSSPDLLLAAAKAAGVVEQFDVALDLFQAFADVPSAPAEAWRDLLKCADAAAARGVVDTALQLARFAIVVAGRDGGALDAAALASARAMMTWQRPGSAAELLGGLGQKGRSEPAEFYAVYASALNRAERAAEIVSRAPAWLAEIGAPDHLRPRQANFWISLVRTTMQAIRKVGGAVALGLFEEGLDQAAPAGDRGALYWWGRSCLCLLRHDWRAAIARIDEAESCPALGPAVSLDLDLERAAIFSRFYLFAEAGAALERSQAGEGKWRLYRPRFAHLEAVIQFCKESGRQACYPECLIDEIMEETARQPIRYAPKDRHLCMISGSLGQGGGERQTLTMIRRMSREPAVRSLSLFVRSVDHRPSDDFFLGEIERSGVEHDIYGRDWTARSDITLLPELRDRPRLALAIDLMPHNLREEIIRLCRRFWDHCPAAVHIWQDMHAVAIACRIAGVPRFFVHRGSLSPKYWQQNEYQFQTHFRPMRHTYRRLLQLPDFVLLNNSRAGCRTDQDWTSWPSPDPFQIVYNAVDFDALGSQIGPNFDLRDSLGIPRDAMVVGGSFRIAAVKRPLVWIEAARRTLEAVPTAHFVIIGDGDLQEEIAGRAAAGGFADRLHLPGRVSNVGDWYRIMNVKLLTSEREGIPNAIIEAQHFGVPIVATDVGGISESIEEGLTGYVVPGPEGGAGPEPYAEKLTAILLDPSWRLAATARAPDFVHAKFSLDKIVWQLLRRYGFSTVDKEPEPLERARLGAAI